MLFTRVCRNLLACNLRTAKLTGKKAQACLLQRETACRQIPFCSARWGAAAGAPGLEGLVPRRRV